MNEKIIRDFDAYLIEMEASKNTRDTYLYAVNNHSKKYGDITKSNVILEKQYRINNKFKPAGINAYLSAMNKFLEFKNGNKLEIVRQLKIQTKHFRENIISQQDYQRLLEVSLSYNNNKLYYFIIKTLANTGVRVSELLKIMREDVLNGSVEVLSKGSKYRHIFFPKSFKAEIVEWIKESGITSGVLFFNKFNKPLTTRGVGDILKKIADKADVDKTKVYPHSFRHFFAKQFLKRSKDISVLSDLLGHDSFSTTQIYMRRTQNEQQNIVNRTVDW